MGRLLEKVWTQRQKPVYLVTTGSYDNTSPKDVSQFLERIAVSWQELFSGARRTIEGCASADAGAFAREELE
jgi:hypothetical protein